MVIYTHALMSHLLSALGKCRRFFGAFLALALGFERGFGLDSEMNVINIRGFSP